MPDNYNINVSIDLEALYRDYSRHLIFWDSDDWVDRYIKIEEPKKPKRDYTYGYLLNKLKEIRNEKY